MASERSDIAGHGFTLDLHNILSLFGKRSLLILFAVKTIADDIYRSCLADGDSSVG